MTLLGGGEVQSEAWTAEAGWGVPGPARRPGPSASQALGYPGPMEELRMESPTPTPLLDLFQGQGGKRGALAGPAGRVLDLTAVGLASAWL